MISNLKYVLNHDQDNINSYNIQMQISKYPKYYGKIIENCELLKYLPNTICGYLENNKNDHDYVLLGQKNKYSIKMYLISTNKMYPNLLLNIDNDEYNFKNEYISKLSEKVDLTINIEHLKNLKKEINLSFVDTNIDFEIKSEKSETNNKEIDKTKRKVLNYFYDISNK